MISLRTILVVADFSADSQHGFAMACALARAWAGRVLVLHVEEPRAVPFELVYCGQQSVLFAYPPQEPESSESLKGRLRDAYAAERGIDVDYQTRTGGVAEQVLRLCEELGCDLVVLGTQGRRQRDRLPAGSLAEAVLETAPCPVLRVRLPVPEPARVRA